MKGYVKDPDAILDYVFDWGPWLDGDEITSSSWNVQSPLTNESADIPTISTTRIFLSGGVEGENYIVTNHITTQGGRIDERSMEIRVRQR